MKYIEWNNGFFLFLLFLQPGDHIEKLNNMNVVGKRHYEVARLLKDIPTNSTFTLRLIEPMKSGFQGIGPRNGSKGGTKKGYGSGKETLRFKANGNAAVEEQVNNFQKQKKNLSKAKKESFKSK